MPCSHCCTILIAVVDWKQNKTGYIQIILLAGKKLSTNEIDVVYTDVDVRVTLTGKCTKLIQC